MARIDFDVTIGPRTAVIAATALLLGLTAGEVASENLSLATYYPSPTGVYTSMLTTAQTYLARDGRGVTIGSSQGVQGTTRLAVMGGALGINTRAPALDVGVEGNIGFGSDVTANAVRGVTWNGGENGTGFWYGINREPSAWSYPYAALKIDFHTGLKLKAHGGYGGVSIWEDYCETGQESCGTGGGGTGTEIARFRINPYGGSYVASRLSVGSSQTPSGDVDVSGGNGVAIFRQPANRCWVLTAGGSCGGGAYQTSQSGVYSRVAPGLATLCCVCPPSGCASLP